MGLFPKIRNNINPVSLPQIMKKLIVIPIMLLYLFMVTGVMVNLHYCGQQLADWKFFGKTDGCGIAGCDKENKKPHKCCKDKVVVVKLSDEQQLVKLNSIIWASDFIQIINNVYNKYCTFSIIHSSENQTFNANAPPGLWQKIPLYKLHSRLTYYG